MQAASPKRSLLLVDVFDYTNINHIMSVNPNFTAKCHITTCIRQLLSCFVNLNRPTA